MKDMAKMVGILTAICLLAGALLAVVNQVTKEPIAKALLEEKMKAIRLVLPEYDNDPAKCTAKITDGDKTWVFYVASKGGLFSGAAFESASDQGYSGTIRIMAGINAEDAIHGIEILQQAETPGLGARIAESSFRDQFREKKITKTIWRVKKDGGDMDAITGATISPRAVLDALQTGLDIYIKNKSEITSAARHE